MVRHTMGGALRVARRRCVTPCVVVRQALCRLAVGAPPSIATPRVAEHARRCPGCAGFADDVAQVRAWLGRREAAGREAVPEAACAALTRELSARVARDLLGLAGLVPPRPKAAVEEDRARLVALLGRRHVERSPWAEALRLLSVPRRPEPTVTAVRERALAVAARLDPLGLDVGLGHLAWLERCGRRAQADAHADGLLARLV